MAYTSKQITAVEEVIDKYTSDTLDNFIRSSVKNVAKTKMTENATNIEVADAVFNYISENHCGDATMAMMCKQICPKSVLLILRNDIIATLK